MLSLKDFKSFEVNDKSFVGGVATPTRSGGNPDNIAEDGNLYHGEGGSSSLVGCPCEGGSTGNGTTSYSISCC